MKVLITGGTGFIGSRLALKHLEKDDCVQIVGQENNAMETENKRLVESKGAPVSLASVTDREKMFELIQGIDLVYHLAAAQHEANIPDQRFWEVNVTGTKNVLEASIHARVKRVVHGSTIGVYGAALEGCIDEYSDLRPVNIYGVTKMEGEKLALSFKEEIPLVIIRISETYGPGDRRLLKLFKGIKKNLFFVIGDGENLHHPIYINDLLEGLVLAATAEKAPGKIFVLAGTEAVTTSEMIKVIAEQLNTKIPKWRLPLSPLLGLATVTENICRPMGIQPPLHRRRMDFFRKSFIFSGKLAAEVLGFAPQVGFKQGVAETAQWYVARGYL